MAFKNWTTAPFSDGFMTILYCDDCTTFELLNLLIEMDSGSHIKNPKIKQYKAKAFRYEPLNLNDKGLLTLDGELLNYGPCQAKIIPSAAVVLSLSSDIHNDSNSNSSNV